MSTNHVRPTKLCTKCNCQISNNNIKIHFEKCNGIPSHSVRKSNNLPINTNYNNEVYKANLASLNWKEIQSYYDDNHSFRDVQKKYKLSSHRLARYIKEGYLKTRSSHETMKLRGTRKIPVMNKELKEKISKGMRKAVLEGRQKTNRPYASRLIIYKHTSWLGNEEVLHGGWEKKVSEFMDSQKIHWCKSKEHFTYIFEESKHEYFPDFYLKDYDLFIEVKGQVMPKDLEKWKQFPRKLLIIDSRIIKNLDAFFGDALKSD